MPLALLLPALLALQSGQPVEASAVPEPAEETTAPESAEARPLREASFDALALALGDDGVQGNAETACRELLARGEAARTHLYARLSADDPQRRFLAAWTLAFVGPDEDQLELVCRILIPVLGDDDVPRNGLMAGEALRALDKRARPWVMSALRYEEDDVRDGLMAVMGGRWPYRYSTANGQPAKPVFLLGPSSSEDWTEPRLSPPADSEDSRIRYLIDNLREVAGGWVVDWKVVELLQWHRDSLPPFLLEAMDSPLLSKRQYAAALMRRMKDSPEFPPKLYLLSLEALQEDGIRYNAQSAAFFLVQQYPSARPYVLVGLRSVDPLVRYRCAAVAACAGEAELAAWVPVLIEALGDDALRGNAIGAARLLAERPQTRPWLVEALDSEDAQRRAFAARTLASQDSFRGAVEWKIRAVGDAMGLGREP